MPDKLIKIRQYMTSLVLRPIQWKLRWLLGQETRKSLEQRYWAFVGPVLEAHNDVFSQDDAQLFLEPWLESVAFSRGPLSDELPRIAFPAMRFLETILTPASKVFEYGAGGSTMFLASRVKELVSVEHNASWFEMTRRAMEAVCAKRDIRWRGVLAEVTSPEQPSSLPFADPLSYASSDKNFFNKEFFAYASVIDEYPDEHFDVILIDGRARPSCFLHAMNKVRCGGYVVLDNAEREHYAWIEDTALRLGFVCREFWGPGPYNDYCWRTIFLQRTGECFALDNLDRKLEKYLNIDDGVFVEAGANDGVGQSNTLYFEMHRNWRGVLIEAVPELYEKCRRLRPRAQVVCAALAAPEQVPGTVKIRYAGLMSVVEGGMRSTEEEDAHIEAGLAVQKLEQTYVTEVPCQTISNILDSCGITHIDLLSLDVEGYEAQALAGLDFGRHAPRYILVEARYRDAIDALLLPRYEVVEMLSHHDVLYRLAAGSNAHFENTSC